VAAAGTREVGGAAAATVVAATIIDAAGCGSTSVAGCGSSITVAACCAPTATGSDSAVDATGRGSEGPAVSRKSPLVAVAVLAAARDALDERRLVGTTASVLSTLAGTRGGTVGATL
jgi:hypothetical protein